MSEQPNHLVDIYQRQPDCGSNRHYDYISIEEHDAAEKTLATKERWGDLTSHEIVVLRDKAHQLGVVKDIVDHADRLAILRCLFSHMENRDEWKTSCLKEREKNREHSTNP